MKGKKMKRVLGCVCAAAVLATSVPVSGLEASASEDTVPTNGGVEFYAGETKVEDASYSLHGVSYDADEEVFIRMDAETAAKIAGTSDLNNGTSAWVNTVYSLSREAAGGRIRFNTNSATINIQAELYAWDASHISHGSKMEAAKYGFDVYVDTAEGSTYAGTVVGETKDDDGDGKVDPGSITVNDTITFDTAEARDITVYFPITIETKSVTISVAEGSTVSEHVNDYNEGKIVFYGSSITQGGSASRPGNTYVNTVGRNLNMEYIDFGMWGRCKGEPAFAEYLAGLGDISVFVMDFDHNISKVAQMEPVHYPFYETIRAAYPDIPIIMMTRPGNNLDNTAATDPSYSTTAEMKALIRTSYETAKANGDKNVHFVDGETFFGYSTAYMSDGSHPNDAGQAKMAEVVEAVIRQVLAGKKNLCIEPTNCETLLYSEDFEDGASDWSVKTDANAASTNFGVVTDADGNSVYQMELTRGTKASTGCYILNKDKTMLDGVNKFKIETKGTLKYVASDAGSGWSYFVLGLLDGNSTYRYDLRIIPRTNRCDVQMYDRTTSTQVAVDTVQFTNLGVASPTNGTTFAFDLEVEVESIKLPDGRNILAIAVSLNGEKAQVFKHFTSDVDFTPGRIAFFLFGAGVEGATFNGTVDDVKVYDTTHKLSYKAEVPATTDAAGTKAHYLCSECGKKFLDEEGIIRISDADLIIAEGCVKMLFSDDFENAEATAENWTPVTTNYSGTETFGIVEENDNSVYQMLVTRTTASGSVSSYISTTAGVLGGYSDYTIELQETMYQNTTWPYMSVRLRSTGANYGYEIMYRPTESGYEIKLKDRSNGASDDRQKIYVEDENLLEQMGKGVVSFNLRLEVSNYVTADNVKKVKILVYFNDNEPAVFDFVPDNADVLINNFCLFLTNGTTKSDEGVHYKGVIDNVKVYTDSHTSEYVALDETAGVKAHYKCSVCDKQFTDKTCKTEATAEWLAYNKLSAIKIQTAPNGTNAENTDIRFVVYVDDYAKYQNVTFKITCSAGTGTATCQDVYIGIYADGNPYTTSDVYGAQGYFATFVLRNNTEADLADTMTIVATWTALDGTTTTETRLVNILAEQTE